MKPTVSLVIATYNRVDLLEELLDDVRAQDLPREDFEVVIVDDGSREPVAARLFAREDPFELEVLTQENGGQALARHNGIMRARGDIIVIVDDDMRLDPSFLSSHKRAIDGGLDVAFGAMIPSKEGLELFEKWHARRIELYMEQVTSGELKIRGADLATGNVAFRRALYIEVGGFDPELRLAEDTELGIRFEKAGAKFGFAVEARTLNRSDHADLDGWIERSRRYGKIYKHIADKHDDHARADPWRFLLVVNPVSRVLLPGAALLPRVGRAAAKAAVHASSLFDKGGQEKVALSGMTFAFGLAYYAGLGEVTGGPRDLVRGFWRYLEKHGVEEIDDGRKSFAGAWRGLRETLDADWSSSVARRAKYLGEDIESSGFAKTAVQKIGVQMLVAVRVMRFLRDSPVPLGGEIASRLIRYIYSAEIHHDAEWDTGGSIIHGNGLVISHGAVIGKNCILAHNVTLGMAFDKDSGQQAAPVLEDDVHVGPGSIILGGVTIGRGSKIGAGCVVTESVPPGSVVLAPAPAAQMRVAKRAAG